MNKDINTEILEKINASLEDLNAKLEKKEVDAYANRILDEDSNRKHHFYSKVQDSFDGIHNNLFNLNSVLIGLFLVLGTFPSDAPKLNLMYSFFPILNMIYLIFMEHKQKEIHRLAARNKKDDAQKIDDENATQTNRSLFSIFSTIGLILFLVIFLSCKNV